MFFQHEEYQLVLEKLVIFKVYIKLRCLFIFRYRDHDFDRRVPRKGKVGGLKDIPKGVHSVRANYKVDETKLMPSLRLGITTDELSEALD